jgi:hypothetical protein
MIDAMGSAMIIAGLVLVGAGGWVLWAFRRREPRGRDSAGGPPAGAGGRMPRRIPAAIRRMSEPTRLSVAVVLILVGYHLVAWGVPPAWASPLAVPRDLWYVVLGVAAAWIGLSLLMDRLEGGGGSSGPI